jgi:hypothetical protein
MYYNKKISSSIDRASRAKHTFSSKAITSKVDNFIKNSSAIPVRAKRITCCARLLIMQTCPPVTSYLVSNSSILMSIIYYSCSQSLRNIIIKFSTAHTLLSQNKMETLFLVRNKVELFFLALFFVRYKIELYEYSNFVLWYLVHKGCVPIAKFTTECARPAKHPAAIVYVCKFRI